MVHLEDASESESDKGNDSQSSTQRTSRTANSETVDKIIRDKIILHEERAVRKARFIVIVAILLCAAAVSVAVYVFASKSDQFSFELAFDGYTKDIMSVVQWDVQYNFALMQQVSAATTTAALLTGATFPFLTQPEYEIAGGYADGMGGIMAAVFAPRVLPEERLDWEAYAEANKGWLIESERLKVVHPGHRDAMHDTFQDHEHDRRLQEEEEKIEIFPEIYRWEMELAFQ